MTSALTSALATAHSDAPILADGRGTLPPQDLWALSGWGTVITCFALTIAAFVVGIVVVPRWHRDQNRGTLSRILVQTITLVVCAALAMASLGLWLNRSYEFLGSWADLFDGSGGDLHSQHVGGPTGLRTERALSALAQAKAAPVSALQADPMSQKDTLKGVSTTTGAQYVTLTVPGTRSGLTQGMTVYLPAGYMQNPQRRYPVITAFSGIPGSPRSWERGFNLSATLHKLVTEGKLQNSIVLMPIVYPGKFDSECVDATDKRKPQYETWLSQDVVGWAKTHLRTIEDPNAWATMGYSAGGWCASMMSVRHPDVFRYSISLAGYFEVDYTKGQVWTRNGDPKYDLPAIVRREKPPVSMYFFTGGEDGLSMPSLSRMRPAVDAPSSLTTRTTRRGGHLVTLWVAHLPVSLTWLGEHAPGFDPRLTD